MTGAVRELRSFLSEAGAAGFQFHTTYLPDAATRDAADPFAPPCGSDADRHRTVRVLSEMANAGGGSHLNFVSADAISYRHVTIFDSEDPLVMKDLVVSNVNVLPTPRGIVADTDADGLDDLTELTLGSCVSDADTDGDGVGDAIEVRLASQPLVADTPIECTDLVSTEREDVDPCATDGATKKWLVFEDKDGDGLNACEERRLGTDDALFDTDADGLPDKLEFVAGINYLEDDRLGDADLDGVVNREELRGHTDPRGNDSQDQLDLAYRYEETRENAQTIFSFSQPQRIVGVRIKSVSPTSSFGVASLEYKAGKNGSPPTLAWCDASRACQSLDDFGPPVPIDLQSRDDVTLSGADSAQSITVTIDSNVCCGPEDVLENIVISGAVRNCLAFRVRNVTLMETGRNPTLGTVGNNQIVVYFSQVPVGSETSPGIYRVASALFNYRVGPPETRTPRIVQLDLRDEDFVIRE